MVLAHNIEVGQRTEDVKINENITFDTMLLSDRSLSGLKKSGFYKPSPIQLHGIPLGKCGFDLLLEAKSGTGKTAVFTIIILEKLDINKGLQAIILAPTREIAAQICDVIKEIGSNYEGLNVAVVMGGLSLQDDIEKFKKRVHIVVGSPGRLKHLIHDDHIDVSSVRLLVIDECDKLMEKCFLSDVNYIFSALPIRKQVIMSSATYPEHCKTFISKFVQKAQHICPNNNTILLGITQHVTIVSYNNNIFRQTQLKFQELLKILSEHQYKQCLVFCNYQARVADVHKWLKREKWPAELLHGQQEQAHRLDALKTLQEYKCRILICTDLAARGIDASNVDLVVNFEPPFEWQTYLHRIGRAGRFGSHGMAITILSEGVEVRKFKATLKTMKIPVNLKYLWTGEEFINENIDNDTLQHSKDASLHDVEDKLNGDELVKELWDSLTCKDNKISKNLQSFEELQKSYQEENILSKTEALSDLNHCDQEKQQCLYNDENNSYKFIELNDIPLKSICNEVFDVETTLHDHLQADVGVNKSENNEHQINIKVIGSCSNENTQLISNDKKLLSDREEIKVNTNGSKLIKDNIKKTVINRSIDDYHHKKNDTELLYEMNKSLLDADLPVSFGGRKYKKDLSKPKCYTKTEMEKKSDLELNKYVNPSIGKKQTITSKENNSKYDRYKKKSHSIINDEIRKASTSNVNIMEGQDTKTPKKQKNHLNYDAWYKQFKAHMKYIEYALYVEEMYKL